MYSIKISEQTLRFSNFIVNTKEFHASKQAIALNLVDTNKIVLPDKSKHNDDGSKFFIVYLLDDDLIRPLCIILPQLGGCIKYFDAVGKIMSFKLEDEGVDLKYNEIRSKIKKALNTRLHSQLFMMMNT